MLYWNPVVNHGVVFLFHVLSKFVDHLQHLLNVSRVRVIPLSSSLSSGIDFPDPLVALHASVSRGHASPSFTTFFGDIRFFELRIINIEGKLCVKIVFSDSRPWTLRLTHSDVQKAQLVPDHTMDLSHYHIIPVISTVFVESHASCKIDSRCHKCCERAGNDISAHRDLYR